ncbi:MAG: hypothetical protein REI64_16890 [Pedobacter sp.]|uniref:hypothetical protein n=1 Tax=Pedobacter sp. TaxID=1411316 RepID=UPI0028090986|nr:hypothetical protein [Pedobacter sp.]MDQ8006481.1 hypothetical protein [Pedobacter sp.]
MQQLQLSPQFKGGVPPKKKSKSYQQKATEAIGYLFELFTDAVDYTPLEVKDEQGIISLEVKTSIGTTFLIDISFNRSELRLQPKFPSGIIQTECKKIRHFIEDLECYLNVAHTWN